MPPLLKLILSIGFMIGLACLLFGAPFVPPFRSWALFAIMMLTTLGNVFVVFVIAFTIYIFFKSKKEEKRADNSNEFIDHSQRAASKME